MSASYTLSTSLPESSKKDVVFVVDGEDISAHKSVLVAASPAFAVLLENADSCRIKVNDAKEIFEQLLQYIYTGQTPSMQLYATDLLSLAHKYRLELLKEICQEWLCSQLSPESMSYLLDLAISFNARKLQTKSIEFIYKFISLK